MTSAICIGECMVELRPVEDGHLRRGFAGDAYNTAVYLKRSAPDVDVETPFRALCTDVLGVRTAYLAAVGPLSPLVGPPLSGTLLSPVLTLGFCRVPVLQGSADELWLCA